MSSSTSDENAFVCDCEVWMRSACGDEGFFKERRRKRYCVMHYPAEDKSDPFQKALDKRLNAGKFDFTGVWFPQEANFSAKRLNEASFRGAKFNSRAHFAKTDFGNYADFRDTQFLDVEFRKAQFIIADFGGAKFIDADFLDAEFQYAYFPNAQFEGDAHFNPARFHQLADFGGAEFHGKAYFGKATFGGSYFGEAKFSALVDFGEVKFTNANFEKAQFDFQVNFGETKFGEDVNFVEAQFNEADFTKADFGGQAKFSGALFRDDVTFEEVVLTKDAFFNNTEFGKKVYFYKTKFVPSRDAATPAATESRFMLNDNKSILSFDSARFKDTFVVENCDLEDMTLRFAGATVEQPDLVIFEGVSLRPIWLARFDARNIQFIKVRWRDLRSRKLIPTEILTLEEENVSTPYESLEIVCRQLAFNAEENNRYEEASRFRFLASETRRRETWLNLRAAPRTWESWRKLNPLLWLYGTVSGYGEHVWQAAAILLGIWLVFASFFFIGQRSGQWWRPLQPGTQTLTITTEATQTGGQTLTLTPGATQTGGETQISLGFREALLYSANVMTLQKPEPLPANKRAKILVLIETVIGPLQLALLALAVRRKFMR